MKRFVLFVLLGFTIPHFLSAQDAGLKGPPDGVRAVAAHPDRVPPGPRAGAQVFQAPRGFEISTQHNEDLKHLEPSPFQTGGTQVNFDTTTTTVAPTATGGFNGLGQNGWIPYDAAIAVGPNHVLVMTNAQW